MNPTNQSAWQSDAEEAIRQHSPDTQVWLNIPNGDSSPTADRGESTQIHRNPSDRPFIEIQRLRGLVAQLIPAETAIASLNWLRDPTPIDRAASHSPPPETPTTPTRDYLDRLATLEAGYTETSDPTERSRLDRQLRQLRDEIELKLASVATLFASIAHPTEFARDGLMGLVEQMSDSGLRQEARMHLDVIVQSHRQIEAQTVTDPLSDSAKAIVGMLIAAEQRQRAIEQLVLADRRGRRWSLAIALAYISAIAMVVGWFVLRGDSEAIASVPLSQQELPLIGIPQSVVVWSWLGSFAAILYRVAYQPIASLGETLKWLLARPLQGIVLGSAVYLILTAILAIFAGTPPDAETPVIQANTADTAVLVLSFFVGASDRLAMATFGAIARRNSQ